MKGTLTWPFVRLYLLTLFYFSANAILNVIIPLKGESLGAANTTIGVIMGAYLFTTMLFRPWAGALIHKHGPIKVLRIILALNGLALLLYTFTGLEGYFAARMLQGVCTAFFSMALQLGLIDTLPEKDRSQGISLYSLFATLPGVIGPLLAAALWQAGDWQLFTAAMIVIALLTGGLGFSARLGPHNDAPAEGKPRPSEAASIRPPLSRLVRNRHLARCSALMLAASVVFGAVTTFIPLYAGRVHNGSAAVFLMLQAGTVVAARWLARKKIPSDGKWHSAFMMTIMLLIAAAAQCVSWSAAVGAPLLYTGAILMGLAQALLYPALTTYLSFVLPPSSRGMLIGLFIASADLGVSLGGIVMGPIADFTSYSTMYTICAVAAGGMIVVSYERRKRSVLQPD